MFWVRLKFFAAIFLSFSILCGMAPIVCAADGDFTLSDTNEGKSIFTDNKFNFIFKPIKDNKGVITNYNVTVSRKDHSFDNYPVQFIYQIVIIDATHKLKIVPKYVYLNANQNEVTETEVINSKERFEDLQSGTYGVKFPKISHTQEDTDLSIRDALFNLKLVYHHKWVKKSGLDMKFFTRDNVALNCPVTLKRAVTLHFKDIAPYSTWMTFTLNTGSTHLNKFKSFGHELTSYSTSPDEYYLQFQ